MLKQHGWLIGGCAGAACAVGSGMAIMLTGGSIPPVAWGLALAGGFGIGAFTLSSRSSSRSKDISRFAEQLLVGDDERIDPERAPEWLSPIATAVSDARAKAMERISTAEGRLREIEIRRRITESERKQVEATLHSLRDAVLVTDTFDEIKMANEAAANLLGFDLMAAVHQPIGEIIKDRSLVEVIEEARAAAENNERRHVEYTMSTTGPDGQPEQRAFDITLTPMPAIGGEGGTSGVVTILRDVTREKEIAQMKSDFVSQVSHELRTPLSSINAYVEMLLDGEATDEGSRQEFYEIIKNEADRLARLIDNMLNISRIEAGIVEMDDTEVDFVKVAREVVEIMQPQAKLKNITLLLK
ncbi:MAG: sensor histidine kinase, partial [Phycisphaerales bacterium]